MPIVQHMRPLIGWSAHMPSTGKQRLLRPPELLHWTVTRVLCYFINWLPFLKKIFYSWIIPLRLIFQVYGYTIAEDSTTEAWATVRSMWVCALDTTAAKIMELAQLQSSIATYIAFNRKNTQVMWTHLHWTAPCSPSLKESYVTRLFVPCILMYKYSCC